MNEQEAKDRCAELAAGHPDRETHRWVPTKAKDGSWAVAKINLPPVKPPSGTESRDSGARIDAPPTGSRPTQGF
jgi:hypothetical protein